MSEPVQDPKDVLRASNADREAVVKRLADGYAEGRLELAELDERTSAAYAAKTVGELKPLTADLPEDAPTGSAVARPASSTPTSSSWQWQPWVRYALPAVILVNVAVWAVLSALSTAHVAAVPWWLIFVVIWAVLGNRGKCGPRSRTTSQQRSRHPGGHGSDSWYHQYTRESQDRFGTHGRSDR